MVDSDWSRNRYGFNDEIYDLFFYCRDSGWDVVESSAAILFEWWWFWVELVWRC